MDLQVVVQMLVSFIQKNIIKCVSFISVKNPHAALICFHYFCILTHNNIIMHHLLTVSHSGSMARVTYCKQIISNSSWYLLNNELVTNICANYFWVKTSPIQNPIHLLSMQFQFLMKEIIILSRYYFNYHYYLTNTNFPLSQVLNA